MHTIRYSIPVSWIGRHVEVRQTRDNLEIELDARHIVRHAPALTQLPQDHLAEHKPPRGEGARRNDPHPELPAKGNGGLTISNSPSPSQHKLVPNPVNVANGEG